jgi:Kef-type K+ transport system membrane component KefB
MTSGLTLVAVVAAGYLAARLAAGALARRFLIVSGAEYLILGVLLGPRVSGLISANVIDSFGPFITLAIGWMGAVIGSEFHLKRMLRFRGELYQVAFIEAVLVVAIVGGAMLAILTRLLAIPLLDALAPAASLGAIAVTTSASGIALAGRRLVRDRAARTPLLRQLQVTGGMDAAVGVLAFGIVLCIVHVPPPGDIRPPTPTEWAVITIGIGVVGGILYHLFLGGERDPDRLFVALAAAITLASGTAAYARLSPLLPTMLIGAILANTARNRHEIGQVLHRVQHPLYLVLLIFAGAAWRVPGRLWVLPIAAFILIRLLAKIGSARVATRLSGMSGALGRDWGLALIGQGSLAAAIALNYRIFDDSDLSNVVFTAGLVSVLATDLLSARFVRAVVRRHHRGGGLAAAAAPER